MKKLLKWGGIGLLVLIFLGAIAGGGDDKGSSSTNNSATDSSSESSDKTTETPKMAGLNETAQDKDLAFTVLKVDTAKNLGNSYTQKTAQGMFYIVTLKIENKGKETASFDSSMAKVIDDQGRSFDRSIDGQTAKGLSEGNVDLFLQQVQPGLSVTGDLVFDLPETIESANLELKGGFFSDGVLVKIR